ncbi:unnamed protein product [Trichobilharzia szidati]|nr:unnamed protein product [Trichobilharzia szidati]
MKFAEKLNAHLTPEWRTQYIDYDELKEHLYKYTQVLESLPCLTEEETKAYLDECDEEFFRLCQNALRKIEVFFSEKIAEANRKFTTLVDELENYIESTQHKSSAWIGGSRSSISRKLTESFVREADKFRPSFRENGSVITTTQSKISKIQLEENSELRRRQSRSKSSDKSKYDALNFNKRKKTFRKLHDLKLAFSEFYLSLVLLQNYQSLNFTGFRKILKKHDKLLRRNTGLIWRQQVVECAHFNTSREVDDLITEVENIFTEKLEQGDRQKAMKRLRVPPLTEKSNPHGLFLFGLYVGIFLAQFIVIVLTGIFLRPLPPYYLPAIRLFRGTFLLIFFLCLFGANTYGWRSSGVNNVLIFELDPRTHLDHFELLQISFFLAVIWGCALIYFLFSEVMHSPAYASPFVLVSFMTLYLFNPFNFGHARARRWLLRILGRIFRAPFAQVSFADFWLADQLNSLNFIFPDIAYFICFYSSQIDWANGMNYIPPVALSSPSSLSTSLVIAPTSGHSNSTSLTLPTCAFNSDKIIADSCRCEGLLFGLDPILRILPAWFRFAQCLRRYRDMDVKKANPHLLNAGKYSTTFLVASCGVWLAIDKDGTFPLVAYVISSFIRSSYTYAWDILMDWGLLDCQSENNLLRDELVYRYKAYYFFAIAEDLIFRLTWIIRICFLRYGYERMEIIVTILYTLEVIRRFIWNFFRLENEHLNNCGQFRAVRDIFITPLPKRPPRTSSLTFDNPNSHNSGLSKFIRTNLTSKNAVQLLAYSPVAGRRSVPDLSSEKTFDPSHKTSHFQACDGLVNQRRIGVVESEYAPSPTFQMPLENEKILPDTAYKNPLHRIWKQLKSLGKKSINVKQCNYEMSAVDSTDNLCHAKPTFTLFVDGEDIQHTPDHSPALYCSGERNFSSSQRSPDIVINQPNLNLSGVSKPRVFVRDKRVLILDRQTDKEWGEPYEKCKLDKCKVAINDYPMPSSSSSSPSKTSIMKSSTSQQRVDQHCDNNDGYPGNSLDINTNLDSPVLKGNSPTIGSLHHSNTSTTFVSQDNSDLDPLCIDVLSPNNTVRDENKTNIVPVNVGVEDQWKCSIPIATISDCESTNISPNKL